MNWPEIPPPLSPDTREDDWQQQQRCEGSWLDVCFNCVFVTFVSPRIHFEFRGAVVKESDMVSTCAHASDVVLVITLQEKSNLLINLSISKAFFCTIKINADKLSANQGSEFGLVWQLSIFPYTASRYMNPVHYYQLESFVHEQSFASVIPIMVGLKQKLNVEGNLPSFCE